MALFHLGLASVSFLIALNLVPRVAKIAVRTGLVDRPGPRKPQARAIPYGGGLAVGVSVIGMVLAGVLAVWLQERHGVVEAFRGLEPHFGGVMERLGELLILLAGGAAFLAVGMADDRADLRPRTKLAAETMIAIAVALRVEPLALFLPPGPVAEIAGRAATVVWIVGIANMFNLLDHEDGICAGVALVCGIGFFGVAVLTGQIFMSAFLAVLCGAVAGFLVFNMPPARIYLGDAGSLFIGYLLAVLCVLFTFYEAHYPLYSFFVPLAIMVVPVFDTIVVVAIRFRRRRPVFEGDRNHIAHRLQALGLSKGTAVAVVCGLTLITAIAANLFYQTGLLGGVGLIVMVLVFLALFLVLERTAKKAGTE